MSMRAFVVKMQELFKLDTGKDDPEKNFRAEKRDIRIPLYQREYKWEDEKINTLILDIKKQYKFLGNIILDEAERWLEIADGQQRITTCYLILVYLYNSYEGSPLEQQSILSILKPYNEFILKNNAVGNYLHEETGHIELKISEDADVYSQKADFERAYQTIESALISLTFPEQVREFKDKLLNSELLVLIKDEHPNTPIEQIFLDINEKAQLLGVEDIFKGHCFEIFSPELYEELRLTWIKLKKCAVGFRELGIKSLSDYIYLFLLEHDRRDLPKKLNHNGRHYLEGKTMDETNTLLQEMIAFGQSVLAFKSNLQNTQYRFTDICPDSNEYRMTDDHIPLKAMCLAILCSPKALYQKLPFMYFVYRMATDSTLRQEIHHEDLRRVVTNLYVYTSLFIFREVKKSKEMIDHTIRKASRDTENRIANIVSAAKILRGAAVEEYRPSPNAKFDELATVYSITDNYKADRNWISLIYSRETNYNLEHFVIPDQRAAKIKWVDDPRSFTIQINGGFAKTNKTKTCNLLVMDYHLNEDLKNYDIVTKIQMVQEWYANREKPIPKHIEVFISFIEAMAEYRTLKTHKTDGATEDTIITDYQAFLNVYFAEEAEAELLSRLREQFKDAFRN